MEGYIVAYESEFDPEIYEGETLEFAHDVAHLHRVLFEELAARRDVEKEVFDHEVAPLDACLGCLALNLRAVDDDACAY